MRITTILCSLCLALAMLISPLAEAQAVKYKVSEEDGKPALTYHGLVPGLDIMGKVRDVLGEPDFEAFWYNYKLKYPSVGRPGLFDTIHMHGKKADSGLSVIEAATIPKGFETRAQILENLGEPEFQLQMATWQLLDYSEKGVRFTLNKDGKATGVAYVPHGFRRVPKGERSLVDLSKLRHGPQPVPANPVKIEGLSVGTAESIITPQGEDWLSHKYTVHDQLKSRIAVFKKDQLTVALVGADVFGMGFNDVQVIRDRARKDLGIDHLVFAMSHTHSGGDLIGVYGHYPAEYVNHVQKQTLAGLTEAMENMQPVAQLKGISKEMPMDGARVMGLIRNARNPGLLDPTFSILQAVDANDKPLATIINFACHPESLSAGPREISADFPGYMCDKVMEETGAQALFLNGALGGMISGDNPERTHDSARDTGLKLAEIVLGMLKHAQPPERFNFAAETRELELPLSNPAFQQMFDQLPRKVRQGRVVTDMTYVELGEAQFVTLPGEVLPEVSYEILEQMQGYPRMLVGLANDQLGYIIPPYDFRDNYYEESMSVGPASAYSVRDMALRMIKEHL